jgi:NADH-quinone oxidoreductase subunit A
MPAACIASAGIVTSGVCCEQTMFALPSGLKSEVKSVGWSILTGIPSQTDLRIVVNLSAYYPVLLFLIVGTGLGIALVSIGKILGPNKPDTEKNAPYECGFEAFEDARMKFDVRYYLVAILFIIFDLETAFLFPWGVALRDIGWPGFLSMMVFLLEFLLGFAYIWRKGGLDWE